LLQKRKYQLWWTDVEPGSRNAKDIGIRWDHDDGAIRPEKGAVGTPHTHPHEQVEYVLEGRFELTFEYHKTIIEPGDTY
jgi:mannose-6-phosphate isomerase-like protein (cupin superfamily)